MPREQTYRTAYVWTISMVAALGGLLFGYDFVVIGGAKPFFEKAFQLTSEFQSGWANSCALVGCLLGAILSGGLSDKFGRKRLLVLASVMFLATAIGTALAATFAWFVMFRIIGGVGIGLASNISPMYIAEVSPAEKRGKLVSLNQLTIVIGILVAQFANYLIAAQGNAADERRVAAIVQTEKIDDAAAIKGFIEKYAPKIKAEATDAFLAKNGPVPGTEAVVAFLKDNKVKVEPAAVDLARHGLVPQNEMTGWRWMFASGVVPAIFFFLAMFVVPESPRWLVKNGRDEAARAILTRIGGPDHAEAELADIEASLTGEIHKVHFRELLEPWLLSILGLGVVLAVFQQWCGINVIFNYAEEVFTKAGYSVSELLLNIVITGGVNLAFTFVALYTVDRLGRRPLMILGAAGLAVIYGTLGACFYFNVQGVMVLSLVVAAIGCFACTLGPVTWVVISEIFPNRIRGAAMSISVFSLWLACFILTLTFPWLNKHLGAHGTFWLYGGICLAGCAFIFARLPETKGKSLEEIERNFR